MFRALSYSRAARPDQPPCHVSGLLLPVFRPLASANPATREGSHGELIFRTGKDIYLNGK
jgi:hypothetical protein